MVGKCIDCGNTCQKIGEINKIGAIKSYCCECYSKIDKNFINEYWCQTCTERVVDPHKKARIYQMNKILANEEDFFKR